MNIKILIFSIIYLLPLVARAQGYNLNEFLEPASDEFNDISYLHIVPEYEENMPAEKAVTIEIYFGEISDSADSLQKLEHIRNILDDDKHTHKTKTEIQIIAENTHEARDSELFEKFVKQLNLQDQKISHSELPDFLNYQAATDSKKRYPAGLGGGRVFWSFIRFASSSAGVFSGLYFMQGIPIGIAASVALVPGLASGGITYFSNTYGSFLTNGKWATWLMESKSKFAKGMRTAFRLNAKSLESSLIKNKSYFHSKHPKIVDNNIGMFTRNAARRATPKLTKLLSRLKTAEEYVKWWVTEVAFTSIAIKMPHAIAGVGGASTLLGSAGEILTGASMGMLAQGPGDIAIQKRKYQKVEQLKADVLSGKTKVNNKKILIDEIDKVLAKTGAHKGYTIHEGSHMLLKKIENWSRSRATILSFFSVTGVGLEIAGVPAARPLLMGVGLWGAGYYANVEGWISPKKITEKFRKIVQDIRNGEVKFSMSFLKSRYCQGPLRYKH